jgi:ATP-dependent exoDNAse (exonuclease V) beta subunit
MSSDSKAFRIYDASAGSGKTFTLAREYLILLLRPGARQAFRQILAITFTNKAVAELKNRILRNLTEFSTVANPEEAPDLFHAVREALQTDSQTIIRRSRAVLQEVLHNYAFFDVSTIDKFNHRILRTFAQDLELPSNFEVVLDTDALLKEAVDALVGKAGSHSKLTDVLVDFALEKAGEDRSWDISWDLFEMGKSLFDENQLSYLNEFSGKSIEDFIHLKKTLLKKRKQVEGALLEEAGEILELLQAHQLDPSDFNRGYFPKFIQKVSQGEFDQDFKAGWKQNFGEEPPYPKRVSQATRDLIDQLLPRLATGFQSIRQGIGRRKFLVNAYYQMAPFTVLGMLQKELQTLREEGGYLPISSFNSIIARELKDQPAPYIYERLGERYRHYFIDEFQDTSQMQWTNLVPLIGNALQGQDDQGEQGSLVLVGDAKQAIYRWRGGKAEQFLRLIDGRANPFALQPGKEALPKNYRSHRPLIEFNNDFFSHLSSYLGQEAYVDLFLKGNRQRHQHDKPGLVQIDFIPADSESAKEDYLDRTLAIIEDLTGRGYTYRDICILTRLTKDGVLLSDRLMKAGVPVISSETLLLKKHPKVQFLIHLLSYLLNPEDKNHIFGMLLFLGRDQEDLHKWVTSHLDRMDSLLKTKYRFNPQAVRLKPVYDLLEEAIAKFSLAGAEDAYLIFLMDLVLEVGRNQDSSVQAFLEYWKRKEDQLSILAPEGFNAVTLMTIHKAKGLEFPVVVLPFADTSIYREKNEKIWLEVDPAEYEGFPHVLLGMKKELLEYAPPAPDRYLGVREKQELDAYNLLYVAHTRAIKALFVISRERSSKDARGTPQKYGDLYTIYLRDKGLWEEGKLSYRFGSLDTGHDPAELHPRDAVHFRYSARGENALSFVTKPGRLWGTERGEAMQFGNVLHYALSLISSREDVEKTLRQLVLEGQLKSQETSRMKTMISQVVDHPGLAPYFDPGLRVLNEREILTKNGLVLRPDRMVFAKEGAAVLDYKTGSPKAGHRTQVQAYRQAVEESGYSVESAILVYIQENKVTPEFL